ncbi:MAG: hypothetical protein Q7S04_00960 [Candidatus Moranbacteria bacterium]|nr:hypothetical protein [Candidatus Moranbacteria bacterium]
MNKILKVGTGLASAVAALAMAFPVYALITNVDVAANAGIQYSKLSLGGKITSKNIKDGTITGKDIKGSTIKSGDIKDETIQSEDIEDGTITVADMAAGTLTATALADGSVTSAKILDSTVASADIAADTIVAADIAAGGVASSEILDDSIVNADINSAAAIAYSKLNLTGLIVTGDITADTILAVDIAAGGVATSEILDGTITGGTAGAGVDIAADTITAANIATSGVATDEILDETILSADIFDGTITAADLGADSVSTSELADSAVDTGAIADGAILTADISTGGVATGNILDGTIAAADIASGAVTAVKLQSAAADLGAANVTVDFGNTNGAFGTNITTDGSVTASNGVLASSYDASESGLTWHLGEIYETTSPLIIDPATSFDRLITANGGLTVVGALTLPVGSISDTAFSANVSLLAQTIESAEITDSTIVAGDIATGAVASDEILDATIVTGDIATGGVATLNILDGTIADADTNGALTGAALAPDTLVAGDIASGAVGTDEIANGVVTGTDLANDITLAGDLTVSGGEVYVTPTASSLSTTEGTIYYDSTDDNLYVYANGAFVDLTAGASAAPTLDDAYNAGSGTETEIHVDTGNLTLSSEDTTAGGGDIMVDLTSTGDFSVQVGGVAFATFNDSGNVVFTGTLGVTGATTVTGAINANGGIANTDAEDLAINANAAQKIILGGTSTGDIDLTRNTNALAGLDVTGALTVTTTSDLQGNVSSSTGTFTIDDAADITGAVTLDGAVTLGNAAADIVTVTGTVAGASPLVFEGLTADEFEITLAVADAGADATVTVPATTGTLVTTGDTATVTSAMIGNDVIVAGDIADGAVATAEILADTILAADIATGAVETTEILDGTIAAADIASGAVTAPKLQAAAADLGGADVTVNFGNTNGAFNTNITTDGTMTATTFIGALTGNVTGTVSGNAGTVTAGVYTTDTGTVTSTMILDSTVVSADIAADTIVAGDIATDAVGTAEILDSTITTTDIAANTIIAGDIASDAIEAAEIATSAVTTTEILDGTIAGGDLAADIAITTTGTGTFNGNAVLGSDATDLVTVNGTVQGASPLVFEGLTADGFETTFAITDGADATITFPATTGTLITTGDSGTVTSTMINNETIVSADIFDGTIAAVDIATDGVGTAEILDATILTGDISTGGVATGNILDATILTGDIATDTILAGNIAAGAVATSEILDATILTGDISTGGVATGNILDATILTGDIATDTILAGNIAAGAVGTSEIADGTVAAGDLATDIIITTTGLANLNGGIAVDTSNFTVSGASGDVLTAGDLDVNGEDIDADGLLDITGGTGVSVNTPAGDIAITAADSGAGFGDIALNADSGAGVVTVTGNLEVAADSTYSIGADATRWSTIYADTLNYSTAITDDNAGNTTVALGDSNSLDTVTITANTAITDDNWSITAPGVATFASVQASIIGSVTPAAGTFTTLIGDTVQSDTTLTFVTSGESLVNSADTFTFTRNTSGTVTITAADDVGAADLIVDTTGAGAITLGSADVTSLTVTTDGTGTAEVALPAGSIDGTEILNGTIADADTDGALTGAALAANTLVAGDIADGAVTTDEILNATIAGGDLAANIALTTTGAVDFSGASSLRIPFGAGLATTACDAAGETGQIYLANTTAGAMTADKMYVCNGTTWLVLN